MSSKKAHPITWYGIFAPHHKGVHAERRDKRSVMMQALLPSGDAQSVILLGYRWGRRYKSIGES